MAVAEIKVVFEIIADEDGRWLVRLFKNIYGEHAQKREARREALNAAADAQRLGYEVEVWDRSEAKQLL